MNVEDILNEHLDMVDNEIKDLFKGHNFPSKLYDMMQYHMGWLDENFKTTTQYGGKRFRPTLCLLVYNALSGVYDKALPAAAALELIHNFSLIHDDIEDRDETRRHKPTIWKLWGEVQGINTGDGMHVLANLAALRLRERDVSDSRVVDVLKILNETVMRLCEGQYLDMSFEETMDVTTDMYLDMVSRKTAALIRATTEIGALLATENEEMIKHFKNFGEMIGIGFQIRDDIIGVWEKSESTGKPKASDIRNKKKSLPVIHALEKSSKEQRKAMQAIYAKEKLTDKDVEKVLDILHKAGSYEYSQNVAKKYENEALKELSNIKVNNKAMDRIKELAMFLVRRSY
ncbi:MAG: polyprenyl synthetase family protein [Candidatus Hydrothermarchaeales archaeon]